MKKTSGKHCKKYVPMCSPEANKVENIKSGRHECQCEATSHNLINNCIHCGRIVCEQEGSGPCFTCNNLVCTSKEQEIIGQETKVGFKLLQKLMGQEGGKISDALRNVPSLQTALKHRDKLIEFDRTIERRMKVIDDENDYFEVDSNQWLSAGEKQILSEKQQQFYDALHSRQKLKLTFDFAGRQIVEEEPNLKIDVDELLKSDTSIFECKSTVDIPFNFNPSYQECLPTEAKQHCSDKLTLARIQDRELQGMSDEGRCLSLHQPHAALLIAGIKKHEGRTWYTSYRGRLWIHAAGKKTTKQEILEAETMYRILVGDCVFPKDYPPGCLLGCIDVVDCLPQEEYSEQFPCGESASPYVLICENATELRIKFPMKGKHKIFQLDENVHTAAKTTLRKQF